MLTASDPPPDISSETFGNCGGHPAAVSGVLVFLPERMGELNACCDGITNASASTKEETVVAERIRMALIFISSLSVGVAVVGQVLG